MFMLVEIHEHTTILPMHYVVRGFQKPDMYLGSQRFDPHKRHWVVSVVVFVPFAD